jgi:hypothetical protein
LAAACRLAHGRRDVVVIRARRGGEAPRAPGSPGGEEDARSGQPLPGAPDAECPLTDWVPGDFFRIPHLAGGLVKRSGAVLFRRVCYHNSDLTRRVEHTMRKAAGYIVRSEELTKALRSAAEKAGAALRSASAFPAIRLAEDQVQLATSPPTRCRLLLVTHGQPATAIGELALPVHSLSPPSLVVAGLDIPLGRGRKLPQPGGALHVVEAPERSEIGMFFRARNVLHVRMLSTSKASGIRAAELSAMVAALQQAELLPAALPLGRARGAVWHPPAAVALDLETHVAKRSLLAGAAGGFADSITGQTLWPSVRSALLAADVAADALDSDDPQGALARFKTLWRKQLADYLRPPSTSLQMLLPLLFVNRRIVARFTAALLFGENI